MSTYQKIDSTEWDVKEAEIVEYLRSIPKSELAVIEKHLTHSIETLGGNRKMFTNALSRLYKEAEKANNAKTVKLSKSDVALAAKLGVTPEVFATIKAQAKPAKS